ncbi:MAG: hypothetical protein MRY64_00530 [Hyphomonadaceae bacterium]|nr:hypothetical protein [Hyphomonadaceae bacterium]
MTQDDLRPLGPLWLASILVGFMALGVGLWMAGVPSHIEWLFVALAVAVGAAVFGGVFFIGTNLLGIHFEARVMDETQIKGSNVEHVTHVERLEDDAANHWLERYVFARNLFGGLIIPLAILGGLFLFAG